MYNEEGALMGMQWWHDNRGNAEIKQVRLFPANIFTLNCLLTLLYMVLEIHEIDVLTDKKIFHNLIDQ